MHRHAPCNIAGPVPTVTLTQMQCTTTISDLPISAMFPGIPVQQLAIDCSHGIVNSLYTVQIPLVSGILQRAGMSAAADRCLPTIDLDSADLILGDTTDGGALPKSICNALRFFNKRVYNTIVDKISTESQETKRISDRDVPASDLVAAMFTLTDRMLQVAYTEHPTDAEIAAACKGTTQLRKILHQLEAPTTPWAHAWTCHVPQLLQTCRTLYPFLCHGFEGRWRDLKGEIKHSTHGQWKAAARGFETVVQYSIARWQLVKYKISLISRTFHVPKTVGAVVWDEFVEYVTQLQH